MSVLLVALHVIQLVSRRAEFAQGTQQNRRACVLPAPRTARMSLTADVRAACGPPVAMMPEMISLYCLRARSTDAASPVSLLAGAECSAPRHV